MYKPIATIVQATLTTPHEPTRYIYYSPENLVLAAVIEDVVHDLKAVGSKAFASASELNKALIGKDTYGYVGIEFDDSFSDINELPINVTVGLRFPLHLRKNPKMVWDNTSILKHSKMDVDYYQVEGFLVVQVKLSEALIRAKNEAVVLPEVILQHYPDVADVDSLDNRVALGGVLFLPVTISAAYLAQVCTKLETFIYDSLMVFLDDCDGKARSFEGHAGTHGCEGMDILVVLVSGGLPAPVHSHRIHGSLAEVALLFAE